MNSKSQTIELNFTVVENANWIQPDSLYKGHNNDYYQKKYKSANIQRYVGMGITVAGLAILHVGIYREFWGSSKLANQDAQKMTERLIYSGFAIANIGAPIWISGYNMKKNNKKAMEHAKSNANLSLGITNNGVGLVLSF